MTDYKDLPYEELKSLHREIGALVVHKRAEALEELQARVNALGFTVEDLVPKRNGKHVTPKYRDPENPPNAWSGKGQRPQWLKDALESGRELKDFRVV
jgi:DNA-binding protein H-NS